MDAKLLKEPRELLMSIKTRIMRSQPEGLADDIDKAERLLKAAAAQAGAAPNDSNVVILAQNAADCRKELSKLTARLAPKAVATVTAPPPAAAAPAPAPSAPAPAAQAAAAPQAVQTFEAVRQPLEDTLQALTGFVKSEYHSETRAQFCQSLETAPALIQSARALLARIRQDIPDTRGFSNAHPAAGQAMFHMKVAKLEGAIDDAGRRLELAVSELLNECFYAVSSLETAASAAAAQPEMTTLKSLFAVLDQVAPGDAQVVAKKSEFLPKAERLYQAALSNIAEARLPAEKYAGADLAQIKDDMAKLYRQKYPEEVRRVVVTSPAWEAREEIELLQDGRPVARRYKYLYAGAAVKQGDKSVVFALGFRRTWTGTGEEYGPLELHSIGASYTILEENIAK